jgi:hypothetical protein
MTTELPSSKTDEDVEASGSDVRSPTRTEPEPRRFFLGRASRWGSVVVGTIAATWLDAPSAFAVAPACCNLANPNGPWCGGIQGANFAGSSCPGSSHKTEWGCCQSGHVYVCEECQTGSSNNCDYGTSYPCSNWFLETGLNC